MFIDFVQVKTAVTYEQTIDYLALDVERNGTCYRGECPRCNAKRSLIITPEKGWYCQSARKGGDVISLVSHVLDISQKDAARKLHDAFLVEKKKEEFDPEEYMKKLSPTNDLGFDEELCRTIGMGVPKKGIHAGRFTVPIRTKNGYVIGFISFTDAKLPKQWRFQ